MSNASKRGGTRSARTDEHGGSERRRRQSKSKVVGGGLGTGSSEDIGAGKTKGKIRCCDRRLKGCVDGKCFDGKWS